jgi:hypothetical protein
MIRSKWHSLRLVHGKRREGPVEGASTILQGHDLTTGVFTVTYAYSSTRDETKQM